MEPGSTVKALFDFETTEESELPLSVGDIITIVEQVDANWVKGTCNGRTGSFPVNFVAQCEDKTSNVSPSKVKAKEGFSGGHEGDLSFEAGKMYYIIMTASRLHNDRLGELVCLPFCSSASYVVKRGKAI